MAFSFLQWLGLGSDVTPTGELTATKNVPVPLPAHGLAKDLDALCAKNQATYTRFRREDGIVQVTLHFPSGDTLCGTAPSTQEAVDQVRAKIATLGDALGVQR